MNYHTNEPWKWKTETIHGFGCRILVGKNAVGDDEQILGDIPGDGAEWVAPMPADEQHIVACVNGCAGLNPAAYRQVVEALKAILESKILDDSRWSGLGPLYRKTVEALALATSEGGA